MVHTCKSCNSCGSSEAVVYVGEGTFIVTNGGTQNVRAASEVERQSWVTALEIAKAKAMRSMESEEDEEEAADGSCSPEEWASVGRKLQTQLNGIQIFNDLMQKHWMSLVEHLTEMETNLDPQGVSNKSGEVGEQATLFGTFTNAMINACAEFLKTAQTHCRLFQHERKQRQRLQDLQEMVETLTQQLEQAVSLHSQKPSVNPSDGQEEDENEFYDTLAESSTPGVNDGHVTLNIPTGTEHCRNNSDSSSEPDETTETNQVVLAVFLENPEVVEEKIEIVEEELVIIKEPERVEEEPVAEVTIKKEPVEEVSTVEEPRPVEQLSVTTMQQLVVLVQKLVF